MKKLIISSVSVFMFASSLSAYTVANSFEYPVYNSQNWVVAQDFQDCRKAAVPRGITRCRHLGEDLNYFDGSDYRNAGQPVKAIANGYVVASGKRKGFAGYIILKHYLDPNNASNYVLSIYAHVSTVNLPQKGTFFQKGEQLTSIATKYEMKKWTNFAPHLHFEIRKSKSITGYQDTYLNDGYMSDRNHFYYDPTDIRTIDWNSGQWLNRDENPQKGFIESHKTIQPIGQTISRGKALKLILDKFKISTKNNGFNPSIFGQGIIVPNDVSPSTPYYNYIVTAYNRGIVKGDNGQFKVNDKATLATFLIMVVNAIPIPKDNPNYKEFYNGADHWAYKYIKTAYNAGLIDNKQYDFDKGITEKMANDILNRAYNYFLGPKSGISIYARWNKKYADIDLYLFSPYDGYQSIEYNSKYVVTNIGDLRQDDGIVYWHKHSSNWGANLDYDSWGGNAQQPWAGFGEERVTVDSSMVRRPGKYSIILCYYDWNKDINPDSAVVEWWGINGGRNINVGHKNFKTLIKKGQCQYVGTLNTYKN